MTVWNVSFCLSQTNSGKTYTISGTPTSPGIISLAVKDLFAFIQTATNRKSLLRVAFLEVYNEKLKGILMISLCGSAKGVGLRNGGPMTAFGD